MKRADVARAIACAIACAVAAGGCACERRIGIDGYADIDVEMPDTGSDDGADVDGAVDLDGTGEDPDGSEIDVPADAPPPVCGNGTVEPGEACDDGNDVQWDGCHECDVTEFQVNTTITADQDGPSVAEGDDGRFIVVWRSSDTYPVFKIMGQLWNAVGERMGGEFQVVSADVSYTWLYTPEVAMSGDGRFVIVWCRGESDDVGYDVFARAYGADGTAAGPEFQVNMRTEGRQFHGSVSMDDDASVFG